MKIKLSEFKKQIREEIISTLAESADYNFWAKKFDTTKHIYVDGGKGGTVCGSVAACLGNNYATTDMKVCPTCLKKKGLQKEDSSALVTSKSGTKSISYKNPQELDQLKRDPNVSSITSTAGQKIKEEVLPNDDRIYDALVNTDHEQLVSEMLAEAEKDESLTLFNFLKGYDFSDELEDNEMIENKQLNEGEILEKQAYTSRGYISNIEQAWSESSDAYDDISEFLKDIEGNENIYGPKADWIREMLIAIKNNKGSKLEEMARIATTIKIGNKEKATFYKEQNAGKWLADMITKVEEAGEEGISQPDLAAALGKGSQQVINPKVRELISAGVFITSAKEKSEPKPSPKKSTTTTSYDSPKPKKNTLSLNTDFDEKEPSKAAIAKADKKVGNSHAAKLSPEQEDKYERIKKGILAKVSKLTKMGKAEMLKSEDMKLLKALINKDEIKALFKSKGVNVKDLVKDIIA